MFTIFNLTTQSDQAERKVATAIAASLRKHTQATGTRSSDEVPTFMPLCLGGHFIVTIEQMLEAPVTDMQGVVNALSKRKSTEEGRFMERPWATLLSAPFSADDYRAVLRQDMILIQ